MEYYLIRKEVKRTNNIWFGKYKFIKKLADGGTSSVYLVKHMELDVFRVVKKLAKTSYAQSQFISEVNSLKSRETLGIPIIYDVEEDNTSYYIIEEYIEGQSLRAYRLNQNDISESRVIDFAIQICEVLHTLHSRKESILYCDLKPENIIIYQEKIKIVDFGASILQKENQNRKLSFGTKGYAAPEQYGLRKLDKRSDIFGIGGILFFLTVGRDYTGKKEDWRLLEQKRMYSSSLKKIIQKCLKHYPMERYETTEQLIKSLNVLQDKQKNKSEKTPYIIAVTGNQKRIGTTHIALMLTVALNKSYGNALYVETTQERVTFSTKRQLGTNKNCPMVRGKIEEIIHKYPTYQFYVCDCGFLGNEENCYQRDYVYRCCNKYLLVSGLKPWEELPKEEMCREKILFLANFTDGILFSHICCAWKQKGKWVRVPYISNPFHIETSCIKELIEEVLYDKTKKE